MNKVFERIGIMMHEHPFRVLFATLAVFLAMVAGARNISMATGNDTLVDSETEVYKTQEAMEYTFGGDSIQVLFKEEQAGALLSIDNITRMWNVENRLKYESGIYSIMSPGTIAHQMTSKQAEMLIGKMGELSDGLNTMGEKLVEVGTTLSEKELPDPKVLESKLASLASAASNFDRLIEGQNNIGKGVSGISQGTAAAAEGIKGAGLKLSELSGMADGNPMLQMQLTALSENLAKSSEALSGISAKAGTLVAGTKSTADALDSIKDKLSAETSGMKDSFKGAISPDELKTMAEGFSTMGNNLTDISEALVTFTDKSAMMEPGLPKVQEELDLMLYEDGNLRSIFTNVVQDNDTAMMIVKLEGGIPDSQKETIIDSLKAALDAEEFETISFVVSGKPVLDASLKAEMKVNMMTMVAFALFIMLIVLAFVFKVRWRMLSLGVVAVSVVATLGFMGWISVPVTMVSMAVFPILIGLGIDYSIQFHNRYEEDGSVVSTVKHVGKAVTIAVLATVLGFISLYASPVPMIRDFGKMLTLGVIISFIGSIFILLPVLHIRKKVTEDNAAAIDRTNAALDANHEDSRLKRVLGAFTGVVLRFRYPVLILVLLLSIFGFMKDSSIGVQTDMESFMPQDMPALTDLHEVRDAVGSTDQIVLYFEGENLASVESLKWTKETSDELIAMYPDVITDIKSLAGTAITFSGDDSLSYAEYEEAVEDIPDSMSRMFINDDGTKSSVIINIRHLSTSELEDFIASLKEGLKDSPQNVQVTGKSVLDVEMVKGLTSGRVTMTGLGLLLIFAALLLIYRNPVKALIPVLPVISIIGISSGIMYFAGISFTPITATLGAMVLGMGSEMTIMLMERYIEERIKGLPKTDAIKTAVGSIGVAVLASGLTTVGGFSVLMLSDFVILKDFGFMTVINVSLALLSTFVLLPPILFILDRFILSRKEKAALKKGVDEASENIA
ncbi:hydrophobe/amphiphile efflux-3 (HAE3) family transporter [Youngiibacter multivorans]|uniref:Hydrophobe/amphiphile efflux-3 (HAE3) family protein n=1 Tax=Youngiibacter multivorans TaxID=937251 RepID=A0ABS4G455_9CLOT|nr:hydrophobe/amphiphile efflux-3 (HAE3) family transporter [Youngiibacter multivorans]MBP1919327.1 hydrophobe/amphiphile efflux-3 (HAE3) family protein [Youngiibacter multivorans]